MKSLPKRPPPPNFTPTPPRHHADFTLFPLLPSEIRRQIWIVSVSEQRLVHISYSFARPLSSTLVAALHVCHESRSVALSSAGGFFAWGACRGAVDFDGPEMLFAKDVYGGKEDGSEGVGRLGGQPPPASSASPLPDCPYSSSTRQHRFALGCSMYHFVSFARDIFIIDSYSSFLIFLQRINTSAKEVLMKGVRELAVLEWKPSGEEELAGFDLEEWANRKLRVWWEKGLWEDAVEGFVGLRGVWVIVDGLDEERRKASREKGANLVEVADVEEDESWRERREAGIGEVEELKEKKGDFWRTPVVRVGKLVVHR